MPRPGPVRFRSTGEPPAATMRHPMTEERRVSDADRRAVRIFYASGAIWRVSVQAYWLVFFLRVVVDLDLPPLQLVLLGTAKELTVLASEIPTGVVADLYSRKWSVVIAFAVTGVAVIGSGAFDSFAALVAMSALWGLGFTFRSGAETAWLTDELGGATAAEPFVIGRARIEFIAGIVGALVAIVVATTASLAAALVMFGFVLLAQALGLAIVMPEAGFEPVGRSRLAEFRGVLTRGSQAVRRIRPLRVLFVSTVLAGFGSEAVDRLYVRRLADLSFASFALSEIVLVGGVVILQSVAAVLLLRRIESGLRGAALPRALALLFAATAVGVVALGLVNVLLVAVVGLIVQGTMRAVAQPVTIAWANAHATSATRATVHSFIGQAHSVGEITGGIVLGTIAAVAGLPVALAGSAVLYLLGAASAARSRGSWDA
jgi:DHA3 family tetracycline resistance protein-like MFS transporter